MYLSELGQFLNYNINSLSQHFPDARILNYVIMPNHLHLIVEIDKGKTSANKNEGQRPNNLGRLNRLARISVATGRDPTKTTHHNSRLALVIGSIKAAVTRYSKMNNIEFGWQTRYHDHYIRNNHDGDRIWNYIDNNIINWDKDCFY
ncbi:MAG: hypothetical protein K2K81_09900 [Muribaculaceae bacterium]|nr:hypothetical protein [Muribaculaceae bacterium]